MAKSKDSNVTVKKKGVGSAVVWGVVILVMMGLGGYGTVQFSGNLRSIGKVGDTDIAVGRYQRQLGEDVQAIQNQIGLRLGMEQAVAFGLDRAALGKVVNQVAVENEARRVEVGAGDRAVAEYLMQQGWFLDFSGKFDADTYRATLRGWGYSVSSYEDEIRATIGRNLLLMSLQQGAVMPQDMAELLYQWSAERRSFVWAELSETDLSSPVGAATEEQLRTWHNDHAASYTQPEKRRISYAWLTPAMLVETFDVADDDLRALYEQRRSEFVQPERRLVEQLVMGTAEEAAAAMADIASGATTFEALVAARGLTLEDVNLDEVTREDLGAAGELVFALAEPGVAGPAETSLGPAIFRVNAILDAHEVTFDEAKADLRHDFATLQAQRSIEEMYEEVNDLLAGGATLEALVDETALELGQVDWWPDVSAGIAGYGAFRQAAAAATTDDEPHVIALDDGGIFVIRLDQIIAPEVQPLDEVRERVAADWRVGAVTAALNALADELLPRIESGENPSSFGLSVNHEYELTREAFLADVPSGLVPKAFELAPGKAARIPGTDGTTTVAIVSTTDVLPPDPADAEMLAARERYAAQVSQQLQSDLVAAFTQNIVSGAGIRIDQAAVDAVNAAMN